MSVQLPCGETLRASRILSDDCSQTRSKESAIDERENARKKKKDTPVKTKERNVAKFAGGLIRMLAEVPTVIALEDSKLVVRDYSQFKALIPSYFYAKKVMTVERRLNKVGFSKKFKGLHCVEYAKTRGIRIDVVDDLRDLELVPVTRPRRIAEFLEFPRVVQPPPFPSEPLPRNDDSYFLPLPAASIDLEWNQARELELLYFQSSDKSTTAASDAAYIMASWKTSNPSVEIEPLTAPRESTMTPRKEEKENGEDYLSSGQHSASKVSPWDVIYRDIKDHQRRIEEIREEHNRCAMQLLFLPSNESLFCDQGDEQTRRSSAAGSLYDLFCYDPSREDDDRLISAHRIGAATDLFKAHEAFSFSDEWPKT